MISKNYNINEFVHAVKDKDAWDVLELALEEAEKADRFIIKNHHQSQEMLNCSQNYSDDLKQFIDYFRFAIKPRYSQGKIYRLYNAHWGATLDN